MRGGEDLGLTGLCSEGEWQYTMQTRDIDTLIPVHGFTPRLYTRRLAGKRLRFFWRTERISNTIPIHLHPTKVSNRIHAIYLGTHLYYFLY